MVGQAWLERVRLIEELAANAWPAPVVQVVGGWRLRYGHGITKRTDSVLPEADGPVGLERKLAVAEGFYSRRGSPARFQITATARPEGLDAVLEARGYRRETPHHVQVAETATVLERLGHAEVAVTETPSPTWLEIWSSVYGLGSRVALGRAILERVGPPSGYATLERDGVPVAVGRAVVERGWAGVFAMGTMPGARRQGAASAVLAGLARWAALQGAERLYLQVSSSNQGAARLYRRAGFASSHDYFFRTLELPA